MSLKLEGVVLSRTEYGDSTLIVDFYSLEGGRLTFSATISKKKNTRFYFSPLTYVAVELYQSKKAKYFRLKEVQSLLTDQLVNRDSEVHAIRYFIAELLKKTLSNEESDPALFQFIINKLIHLYSSDSKGKFVVEFLEELTPYLGIDLEELKNQNGNDSGFEFGLSKMEWECLVGETNNSNKVYLNALLAFYTFHFEGVSQLKSKAVLAEVFN